MKPGARPPIVALTQGDPAGIGPEVAIKLLAGEPAATHKWKPLLIAERAGLEALRKHFSGDWPDRLVWLDAAPQREEFENLEREKLAVLDPVRRARTVKFGWSGPSDVKGALAALDSGIELARAGTVDALITGPVNKASIARHGLPDFRGHTEYLAQACGLKRYGRDFLMTFLAPDLQVALLTTHLPLAEAIRTIDQAKVVEALDLLSRTSGGRIALSGLNPHAGEEGILGEEERAILGPAIETARARGIDVSGPESPDTVFHRARRGEFDWVLALYHDQGLIPIKTVAFGWATNWTLGLPFVRTSVDHGTAFSIAGKDQADVGPTRSVLDTTLRLVKGSLPKVRRAAGKTHRG